MVSYWNSLVFAQHDFVFRIQAILHSPVALGVYPGED
jgi:hypothetical protein